MLWAKTTLGLDLGQNEIKLVLAQHRRGQVHILDALRLPLPGETASSEAEREAQIERVLGAFWERSRRPAVTIAVQVPMRESIVKVIQLPPASPENVAKIIQFEAESQLPLPLDEVEFDHALLGPAPSGETEVLLAACRKNLVAACLLPLERAGLVPEVIGISALALVNCFAPRPPGQATALLDLGARATEIAILNAAGQLRAARSIALSGQDLTRAFQEDLGLEAGAAEREKRLRGLEVKGPRITHWIEELVEEVRLSLQAFRASPGGTAVERILLLGGGAGLRGLTDLLADRLGVSVAVGDPWEGLVVVPEVNVARHLFAVATGLALYGDTPALAVNLLPRRRTEAQLALQKQRTLRWGAVLALIALLFGGLGFFYDLSTKEQLAKQLAAEIEQQKQLIDRRVEFVHLPTQVKMMRNLIAEVRGKLNWLDVLREVSIRKPDSVWFTEMSFDKRRAAVFKGVALYNSAVAEVMEQLRQTEMFLDVRLDYANATQMEGRTVYEFQITCPVRRPEEGRRR